MSSVCPHPSVFISNLPNSLQVEDEFICCVCGGVMHDPVTVPACGHGFGRQCGLVTDLKVVAADGSLGTLDSASLHSCPHEGCAETFTVSDLRSDAKMRSLISKLPVACPNTCGWVGQWGAQDHHQSKVCPMELLPCPFDCGRFVVRDNINAHKKECLRRFEQCEHCLVSVRYQDRPLHEARCDLRPVTCNGCGEVIQARGLQDHQRDLCAGTLVSCPFEAFGCQAGPIPRREVEAHIEGSLHQHCLNLVGQIQKERAQHLEKTTLLEARIRELEAQKGLTDSEHEAQTDALLNKASSAPSKPIKAGSRPVSAAPGRSSPSNAKAPSGRSATIELLASLESVVSRQQQVIDRFMSGSVLCVDAKLALCASGSSSPSAPAFPTINAALKVAVPGDIIIVRPGSYKENLFLTTPNVWIKGASKEAVIIVGCVSVKWPSSQPFFDLNETEASSPLGATSTLLSDPAKLVPATQAYDNLALSNVTIRNVEDAVSPAIRVKCEGSNVFPRIQNCVIISHNLACVVVDEGQPSFESCTMSESKQFGLFWRAKPPATPSTTFSSRVSRKNSATSIHKDAPFGDKCDQSFALTEADVTDSFPQSPICGRIIDCHIFNNKAPNIVVESGVLAIYNAIVEGSAANGILIKSGANVHVEGSTIRNNGYSNIDVLPSGSLRIVSSLLHTSSKAGLYITGRAFVHSTRIFDNALPNVVVMSDAVALFVGSKINGSQQYGLVAKARSQVRLTGCEVKGNGFDNVVADEAAVVNVD